MPKARTLTIGIFAVLTQQERELISSQGKAALQAKKKHGHKLDTPARSRAMEAVKQKVQCSDNNRRAAALVSLTGGLLTSVRPIDGKDLSGVLLSKGQRDRQEFFYFMDCKLQVYRQGNWKLKLPYGGNAGTPGMKAVAPHPILLFDLSKDAGEVNNLAERHPEKVAQMQAQVKSFRQFLGQGRPPSS